MQEQLDYPRSFVIEYTQPGFEKYISFNLYREPNGNSWNGYYKGCRLRLWNNGDYWIVSGMIDGIEGAYFRTRDEHCPISKIQALVQCACFYLDTVTKPNQDI